MLVKLNKKYPKRRAIVTGAGSGVGLEITKILSKLGWRILAIDLATDKLKHLRNVKEVALDVTERKSLTACLTVYCEDNAGVDILFNNVGVGEGVRFSDYDLSHWDRVIDVNLKSIITATRVVYPFLKNQNGGLIVNMASAAGFANLPNMSPYNVTKAALISFSESLAHEFSVDNIRVKCVTPSFFQSNIMQHSLGSEDVVNSAKRVVANAKLTSKQAALIILEQLHSKKETIRFPFSSRLLFHAKKYFPNTYNKLVRRYLVK